MPTTLPVELNREQLHSISGPAEFTTDGSFHVDLSNHGEGVHVHLHLDDTLSSVARIDDGNVFVSGDTTSSVDVVVDNAPSTPVTGRLQIATGYGAESTHVAVTVEPTTEPTRSVAVDESLSKPKPQPQKRPATAGFVESLPGPDVVPFVLFVLIAIAVAIGAVVFVSPASPAILVGVGVVLGSAITALVFALR